MKVKYIIILILARWNNTNLKLIIKLSIIKQKEKITKPNLYKNKSIMSTKRKVYVLYSLLGDIVPKVYKTKASLKPFIDKEPNLRYY